MKKSVIVGTVLAGCGPGAAPEPMPPPEPPAPPVVAPAPPVDAAPPAAPIEEAPVAAEEPPFVDPGPAPKDKEARWRWAVKQLPELATLYRAGTPSVAAQVDRKKRVILHSPNLADSRVEGLAGYQRCSPLEFVLRKGVLLTRIPADGSRARPEVKSDYVELTLGAEVGDRDALLRREFTTSGGCGGQAPGISDNTPEVLRYAGAPVQYGVRCQTKEVAAPCSDGSSITCAICRPRLYEIDPRAGGYEVIGRVQRGRLAGVTCEACPPNPGRDALPELGAIVSAQRLVHRFEDGEEFYRDREACLAAAAHLPLPEPLADEHAYGFPVHPELRRICSQQAVTPIDGGGFLEVDWSLYATVLPPKQVADWYGARLGTQLMAATQRDRWSAKLGDGALDVAGPRDPGPTCRSGAPKEARTVVRLSTAVRR